MLYYGGGEELERWAVRPVPQAESPWPGLGAKLCHHCRQCRLRVIQILSPLAPFLLLSPPPSSPLSIVSCENATEWEWEGSCGAS